jgi:caffeoyl-CoA O-methyltransferase
MNFISPDLENYCLKNSSTPSEDCEAILTYTRAELTDHYMLTGPLEGSFLQLLIKSINARRVLEFGTFTGYSALTMAEALPPDGEVVTLDINPETVSIAKKFWEKSPNGPKITSLLGRAAETVKTLDGEFDFVFIDADKPSYVQYLELSLPRLSKKGMIVADNTLFSGEVLNPKSDNAKGIENFNRRVKEDKSLEHTLIPLRDGMMLIRKI